MKTTVHYPKAHFGNNCSITFPFPLPALRSAHAAMPQRAQLAAKLPWPGISFSNEAFKRICLCKDAKNGLHTKLGRRKGFDTGPGGLRGGCGRPHRARGLARHSARRFGAHGSSPLPPSNLPTGLGRWETWLWPQLPAQTRALQIPARSGPATARRSSANRVLQQVPAAPQ